MRGFVVQLKGNMRNRISFSLFNRLGRYWYKVINYMDLGMLLYIFEDIKKANTPNACYSGVVKHAPKKKN